MQKHKRGLGDAVKSLDIAKPMRSRLSDTLVPPPVPERKPQPVHRLHDPKAVAERVWIKLMSEGAESDFEVRFTLNDGKSFALRGDKEGFASIQPIEFFDVPQELLLQKFAGSVVKIVLFSDDKHYTFTAYSDFAEWLELA